MIMKNIYSIIVFAIFLLSCSSDPKNNTQKEAVEEVTNKVTLTKEQATLAQLVLAPIELGRMKGTAHLNGVIDVPPTGMASVSMPLGGYVQDINLIPGNFVKKGAVLATVKDPAFIQLQENYLASMAKLTYLQQDLDRQKLLLNEEAVSKKSYQQIQADYNTINIQLRALSEQLKLINICL